jgi:hypothetical protein
VTFAAPTRVLARPLTAGPTNFVGTSRVVPTSIATAFADSLARLCGCLGLDHGSALSARVFVLLVGFRDRTFRSLVSAAPFLSLADCVAALMLRRITLRVRAGCLALVACAVVTFC